MKTSESIKEISIALLKVQDKFLVIKKESKGQRNTYASYDQLIAKAKPILTEAGIVILQPMDHIDGISAVTTVLIHSKSGEFFQSTSPITQMSDILNKDGNSTINQAQREGGGISYAKRYALGAMLAWATGDYDFDQSTIDHGQTTKVKDWIIKYVKINKPEDLQKVSHDLEILNEEESRAYLEKYKKGIETK